MGSYSATIMTSFSLPSLFCEEDQSCFTTLYDYGDETFFRPRVDESDHEFFEELILGEADCLLRKDKDPGHFQISIEERSMSINSRLDATITSFGFQKKTAYLSVLYLDRFLSKRSVSGFKEFLDRGKSWTVRLLSVACLSVAAKMEEYRAPALEEYNKICADEFNFQAEVVQRMELLVLKTLEWRMNLITPFDYICYFIDRIYGETEPNGLTFTANELTMATLKDVKFLGFPSSVIAAASVLAACDYQITRKLLELRIDLMSSSWGSPHKERIISCYNAMQKVINPIDLPLKQSNSESEINDFTEHYPLVGHKRKLVSNDTDQHRDKIH